MITKKLLTFSLLLLSFNFYFTQEVEIKDDKVLLDGKQILKAEKINMIEYSFYNLKSDDEILLYRQMDNGTSRYQDDDYYVLNFLTEKVKVESNDFYKIASFMNSKKSMEKLIKWLLKEKVLTNDGELNSDRLAIFKEKYDQNITERTIR
jgi:regulatory protein YycI of two-component signal transduction system YycFG